MQISHSSIGYANLQFESRYLDIGQSYKSWWISQGFLRSALIFSFAKAEANTMKRSLKHVQHFLQPLLQPQEISLWQDFEAFGNVTL